MDLIRLVMTMMLPIWYALGRLLSDNGNPDLLQQYRFRQYRFNICPPYCCFQHVCLSHCVCLLLNLSIRLLQYRCLKMSVPPLPCLLQ